MPTYQYKNRNGSITERMLPVAQRDRYPNRITVPQTLGVAEYGRASHPYTFAKQMRKGYQRIEEKNEPWKLEWSKTQVAKMLNQMESS